MAMDQQRLIEQTERDPGIGRDLITAVGQRSDVDDRPAAGRLPADRLINPAQFRNPDLVAAQKPFSVDSSEFAINDRHFAGSPSRPARPDSCAYASSDAGGEKRTMKRTSDLSMPMPNATVATTIRTWPDMKLSWASERAAGFMPA